MADGQGRTGKLCREPEQEPAASKHNKMPVSHSQATAGGPAKVAPVAGNASDWLADAEAKLGPKTAATGSAKLESSKDTNEFSISEFNGDPKNEYAFYKYKDFAIDNPKEWEAWVNSHPDKCHDLSLSELKDKKREFAKLQHAIYKAIGNFDVNRSSLIECLYDDGEYVDQKTIDSMKGKDRDEAVDLFVQKRSEYKQRKEMYDALKGQFQAKENALQEKVRLSGVALQEEKNGRTKALQEEREKSAESIRTLKRQHVWEKRDGVDKCKKFKSNAEGAAALGACGVVAVGACSFVTLPLPLMLTPGPLIAAGLAGATAASYALSRLDDIV